MNKTRLEQLKEQFMNRFDLDSTWQLGSVCFEDGTELWAFFESSYKSLANEILEKCRLEKATYKPKRVEIQYRKDGSVLRIEETPLDHVEVDTTDRYNIAVEDLNKKIELLKGEYGK